MGRKADPKGKDRTRTIQLAGDVADIAQKLADKGALSATLSELLRHNYGFGDKIDEKKRELEATHEQRVALQRREEDLAAAIDELEQQQIHHQTNVRPAIERKLRILHERREKLSNELGKFSFLLSPNELTRKKNAAAEVDRLILEANQELEDLQ